MKKVLFLVFTLFVQTAFGQNAQGTEIIQELQKQIKDFYESEGVMGMAVSISLDSKLILSEGFGYVSLDRTKKVDPSTTMFRIASLSKPITSTCLGVLADEGKIAFDDSAYKYVPDFPKKDFDFSLRQLAAHTSGIRHYRWYEAENKKDLSIEQGLKKFRKSKLKFKPGSQYSYSSYGYNLLGLAIEKAIGKDFFDVVKESVLDPLEMKNTIADDGNYSGEEVSGFFKKNKKGIKEEKAVNIFFKLPSGGFLSTSEDLIRLGNSYINATILKPKTQEEILTRQTIAKGKTRYGLGWGISTDKNDRTFYSHSGGGVGAVSRIVVFPEEKLCITVVINTNCDYLKLVDVSQNIANYIIENRANL